MYSLHTLDARERLSADNLLLCYTVDSIDYSVTLGKLRSITITLLTVRSISGVLSATGLAHHLAWLRAYVINL
jgi:hypothetical protein